MTRLPWQHTRSRTKSGGEKTSLSNTQDWFSRSTTEPSRQALTDLVKAHHRGDSDESNKTSLRSRTNTVTSTLSQRARSRAGSSDDEAWSRPSSRGACDGSMQYFERQEGSKKALMSKSSRLLRKTSSRMSLSSAGSSSTLGLTSPSRSSRGSIATARADEMRAKISAPFDFQHITHTEDTHFTGLRRIEEAALADQYIAAINEQHPAPGLRGITASDLEQTVPNELDHAVSSDVAVPPPTALLAELPKTPPRPQPPPKDRPLLDIAFSDTQNLLDDQDLGSTGLMWLAAHGDGVMNNLATDDHVDRTDLNSKPLPEIPVIHAITTEDNTAMAITAESLPSPPLPVPPAFGSRQTLGTYQQRHLSSAHTQRASLHRAAKSSMPNLVATNNLLVAPRSLPRHHSDMALSQQAKMTSSTVSTRTSMSFAAIDTMNWEDAVDEAWDVDDEEREISDGSFLSIHSDKDPRPLEAPAVDSAGSTPLMMTVPSSAPRSPDRPSHTHTIETHQLESVKEDEPSTELAGLGISPCPAAGTVQPTSRLSRSSSVHFPRRRSSLSYHANDTLTRTSSQESIILSIASSIFGTQRSSNSSMSAVDLASGCTGQTGDSAPRACDCDEGREAEESLLGTARPESGCLPPDILEQISHFGATFSTEQAPTVQDVPPVPHLPRQANRKSVPKPLVPERRSSVVATVHTGKHRQRSNTWGNRPRQSSYVSYSLFPVAQQPSSAAATLS